MEVVVWDGFYPSFPYACKIRAYMRKYIVLAQIGATAWPALVQMGPDGEID